jgi:hypothetical protein
MSVPNPSIRPPRLVPRRLVDSRPGSTQTRRQFSQFPLTSVEPNAIGPAREAAVPRIPNLSADERGASWLVLLSSA